MYEKIVELLKSGQFKKAKNWIADEINKEPNCPYLHTQLANVLWNLGDYTTALAVAEKAKQIDAHYPLLNFTVGRIRMSLEQFEQALFEWDTLLSEDFEVLKEKGFGKKWALSVINDTRFYKAECLYHLYKDKEAAIIMEEHLKNRKKGQESEFSMKEAKEFLRMLKYSTENGSRTDDYSSGCLTTKQADRIAQFMEKMEGEKQIDRLTEYLKKKCKEYPKEYWLKTCLAEYLYRQGKAESLHYAEEAYKMAPNDMLVVYNYSAALQLNGKCKDAAEMLNTIIHKDINAIAYSEHGEGLRWARSLVNRSRSLLSKCID